MVSPIGLPLPSVRITLAPASAVPLMVVPLLGSITGAGGATASTVVAACGPVLPVGSVAVATITVPLASGVPGVKLQLPLPSAVTCPIGGDLADRVAVAVGEDHRGTSLGGTGDHATVARIDHRGCWRQRVDGGAGGTAVVAGGVLGQRIDHRAIGQRRSGREGPVAAAVGGDLADRVGRAVNEDGTLTYSFVEALAAGHPGFIVRMLGGFIFLLGMFLMAYNTWRTVSAAKPAEYEAAAQIA